MLASTFKLAAVALMCVGVGSIQKQAEVTVAGIRASPDPLPYARFVGGKAGWVLLSDLSGKQEPGHVAMIERSKTQRAGCRVCGELIGKGEPRLGLPLPDQRGYRGVISAWQHWRCSRLTLKQCPSLVHWIQGWKGFGNSTEMQMIEDTLRSEAPPLDSEEDSSDVALDGGITLAGTMEAPAAMECSNVSGGVLADEMGLGKTIQTIALILQQRASDAAWRLARPTLPTPPARFCAGTLVVCPVSAMSQWHNEILRFTAPGALSVLVYHGPDRSICAPRDLAKFDVVLTSYSILEADWRRAVEGRKVACAYCDRKFLPRTLVQHNRYFCGPDSRRTARLSKTLRTREEVQVQPKSDAPTPFNIYRKFVASMEEGEEPVEADAVDNFSPSKRAISSVIDSVADADITPGKRSAASLSSGSTISSDDGSLAGREKQGNRVVKGEGSSAQEEVSEEQNDRKKSSSKEEIDDDDAALISSRVEESEKTVSSSSPGEEDEETRALRESAVPSPLHSIDWTRVVLDEAHRIKGRTTSTARAALALEARRRWCLSGTPLQNRVGDLYSIVRFLRWEPWAYYFCQIAGCACKSLNFDFGRRNARCKTCKHPPMRHYSHFNRIVINPIKRYGNRGSGRGAMRTLRKQVVKGVLLRRTKEQRGHELSLPKRTVRIRRDNMTSSEWVFYNSLYHKSREQFDHLEEMGTLANNYAHIFDLLSSLRQAVDHPYLVLLGKPRLLNDLSRLNNSILDHFAAGLMPKNADGGRISGAASDEARGICVACWGAPTDEIAATDAHEDSEQSMVMSKCHHAFHRSCILSLLNTTFFNTTDTEPLIAEPKMKSDSGTAGAGKEDGEAAVLRCPACMVPLSVDLRPNGHGFRGRGRARGSKNSILARVEASNFVSSSKLEALLEEVEVMCKKPGSKGVVFSQFTRMLDLVQFRLGRAGIGAVKLVGGMPRIARDNAVSAFTSNPAIRVLLVSLKAGGEGLNLQIADHVFLIDPWWNPASEMQAMDRAHRIGQTREVTAVRFLMRDTIEDRILELQAKKQLAISGTIDGDASAVKQLSKEDLCFLFNR